MSDPDSKFFSEAQTRNEIIKLEADFLATTTSLPTKYGLAVNTLSKLKTLEAENKIPSAQLVCDILVKDAATQILRYLYILLPLEEIQRRINIEFKVDWEITWRHVEVDHKSEIEDYKRRIAFRKFMVGDQAPIETSTNVTDLQASQIVKKPIFLKKLDPVDLDMFSDSSALIGVEVPFQKVDRPVTHYRLLTNQGSAPIFLHQTLCRSLAKSYGDELPAVVNCRVKALKELDASKGNEYGVLRGQKFWVVDVDFIE
eukprot:TRINITY_DN1465_c0_g1_i1.p1 TRINITY_DN1465_c0_g1~~TRINITY_DN1465_c0_g1_i1.p1  ORF type:complete len:257 (+),score=54.33 TRINITY_DN1465_c0_g1_i1:58-828(+)